MGRFISAAVLRELAKQGKEIVLEENSVLTPSAKDLAKELGLTLTHGQRVSLPLCPGSQLAPAGAAAAGRTQPGAGQDLKQQVRTIMEEILRPACPQPKALHVRGEQVVIQPFDQAPAGQRIGLTDVVTAKEGNLCAGFMTFDHSELPWFLNYDEADYIIEGDFVLQVGDKVFRAKAGDVVYIPKGSQVVFSSPAFCKVFYVTYPANWADFCD